jgi:hypothetical protein
MTQYLIGFLIGVGLTLALAAAYYVWFFWSMTWR